jgi:hypothetical protein
MPLIKISSKHTFDKNQSNIKNLNSMDMTLIKPENISKLVNSSDSQIVKIKLDSKTPTPKNITPRRSNQVEAIKNGLNSKYKSIIQSPNNPSSKSPKQDLK